MTSFMIEIVNKEANAPGSQLENENTQLEQHPWPYLAQSSS